LGWNILRIWSTDWWYDARKCIDDLDDKLKKLLKEPENTMVTLKTDTSDSIEDEQETGELDEEETIVESDDPVFDPSVVNLSCEGDFFISRGIVREQLKEVVELLAPIGRDECFMMVSKAWGFARRGRRIEGYLDECSKGIHRTISGDQTYFWKSPDQVESLDHFRKPMEGERRDPLSVAPEELQFAFLPILRANIQIQKTDLFREVLKTLGGQALTGRVIEAMEPGLKYLVDQNFVEIKDDLVLYNI
jgi:hypothetical protein